MSWQGFGLRPLLTVSCLYSPFASQLSISAHSTALLSRLTYGWHTCLCTYKNGCGHVPSVTLSCRLAVDEQADSLQDGIDSGSAALKDGIDSTAASAQEAADDFEKRASAAADRVESNIDQASGENC